CSNSGPFLILSFEASTITEDASQLISLINCGGKTTFFPGSHFPVSTTRNRITQLSSSMIKSSTSPIAPSLALIAKTSTELVLQRCGSPGALKASVWASARIASSSGSDGISIIPVVPMPAPQRGPPQYAVQG